MSTVYRSTTFSSGWICLFVTQQYKHHRAISMAGIRPDLSSDLVLFTFSLRPVYKVLLLGIVNYFAFIFPFQFHLSRQRISVEFKYITTAFVLISGGCQSTMCPINHNKLRRGIHCGSRRMLQVCNCPKVSHQYAIICM